MVLLKLKGIKFLMQERGTRFVSELEEHHADYEPALILLVSHGDLLQILQTGFERMDPRGHRALPHLDPCEVRQVHLRE